ncbi:Clusterin-associated protein 1 [Halotydeus destructor]|nr:Clusterin-associated protein 1 [Halotydeus destructor]
MSFRELRNFAEIMRVLGYPRIISVENFRNANFTLMAEVLQWLIQRYDSSIGLPLEIGNEEERVTFVKTAALLMAVKADIKLNTKKLYMADGHAVQELLKIASLLYKAAQVSKDVDSSDSGHRKNWQHLVNEAKLATLKKSRELASSITLKGAELYDLLAKELEMRERRTFVLTRQLEISDVDKGLREELRAIEKDIESTNFKIDNVASDEDNLEEKLEKKRSELERNQKRLQALKSVRPAFMDEYEKLEEELNYVYNLYVVKFRCLVFLEQQLEDVEKTELVQKQEHEENVRKMVETMRDEQSLVANDESGGSGNEDDNASSDDGKEPVVRTGSRDQKLTRRSTINTTTAKRSAATGRVRAFGSVLSSTGEKEESLDSDFELEGEDGSELDSEDEMELLNLTAVEAEDKVMSAAPDRQTRPIGRLSPGSDDDF